MNKKLYIKDLKEKIADLKVDNEAMREKLNQSSSHQDIDLSNGAVVTGNNLLRVDKANITWDVEKITLTDDLKTEIQDLIKKEFEEYKKKENGDAIY